MLQLEEHVREKHDDSAGGRMKSNFKQFLGKLSIKSVSRISTSIIMT